MIFNWFKSRGDEKAMARSLDMAGPGFREKGKSRFGEAYGDQKRGAVKDSGRALDHLLKRHGSKLASKPTKEAKPKPVKGAADEPDDGAMDAAMAGWRLARLPSEVFAPLVAIMLAVVLSFLVLTHLALRNNQLGREVSRLNSRKVELSDMNRRLRAEMDLLTVFEDLEIVARDRLGLVSPSKAQIEIIE